MLKASGNQQIFGSTIWLREYEIYRKHNGIKTFDERQKRYCIFGKTREFSTVQGILKIENICCEKLKKFNTLGNKFSESW